MTPRIARQTVAPPATGGNGRTDGPVENRRDFAKS